MNGKSFLTTLAIVVCITGCAREEAAPEEFPPAAGNESARQLPEVAHTADPLNPPVPSSPVAAPADPGPSSANRLPTTIARERAGQVSQGLGGGTDID